MSFGIMLTPEHTNNLIYILDILDRMETHIKVFNPYSHDLYHQSSMNLLKESIKFLKGTYPEVEPVEVN